MLATTIGLRGNATAIAVPSWMRSVASAAKASGMNGIVRDLGGHDAVEAGGLRALRHLGDLAPVVQGYGGLDAHRGTSSRGRHGTRRATACR